MKIQRAYRYWLDLNAQQSEQVNLYSSHCRTLWNKLLALNLVRLKSRHRVMYYYELNNFIQFLKRTDEFSFLKQVLAQVL